MTDGPTDRPAPDPPTAAALGLMADARMQLGTACIGVGELLFAYTDGVVDAAGSGQAYGEQRMLEVLGHVSPSAEALLEELDRSLHAYVADVEPFDDITAMAVRRVG